MSRSSHALLVILMLFGSISLFGENIFKKADSFNQVLDNAKTKRRLLLTYAASPAVASCIAMEKATFRDSEIQLLLQESFYPIKINLSNELGKEWAEKFEIVHSPTLLFFDTQGTLIKQVENGVSSRELKSILEDVAFYNINGHWPMETPPIVLTATVPDQALLSSSNKAQEVQGCTVFKSQSTSTTIFKILLNQFATTDSTIKGVVERAKLDYPQHPVCFKLVREDQNSYFQVLIGTFNKQDDAQVLLKSLKATGYKDAKLLSTTSSAEKKP